MIKLLRLLQGYVLFTAEGGFTERFLNLCKINGISLWNVENDGVKVKAFTTSKDFERINIAAEKSAMSVKIEQERGLKFFVKRYKLRVGVVCGLFLSFCAVLYLSGCIWNVKIQEKAGAKVEAFTESLAELGVKPGARKSRIDILSVQEEMLKRHKELLWVSLNIFGGRAELEYTLTTVKSPSPETFLPSNLVAGKNGVITLLECYRGTPAVKEGHTVAEGSILISGVVKNKDGSEKLIQAMGRVYARTDNHITADVHLEDEGYITSVVQPSYGAVAFGVQIPFGLYPSGDMTSVRRVFLQGSEAELPVGIVRYDALELKEAKVVLTADNARLGGLLDVVREKRLDYELAEMKSVKYTAVNRMDKCRVQAHIVCVEDISAEKPLSVEKN